jgi:hypothetical protein
LPGPTECNSAVRSRQPEDAGARTEMPYSCSRVPDGANIFSARQLFGVESVAGKSGLAGGDEHLDRQHESTVGLIVRQPPANVLADPSAGVLR